MNDDYEYFNNKRPDRVYLSRSLSTKQYRKDAEGEVEDFERPFRVVSKVMDAAESHQFFKDGQQVFATHHRRVTSRDRGEVL